MRAAAHRVWSTLSLPPAARADNRGATSTPPSGRMRSGRDPAGGSFAANTTGALSLAVRQAVTTTWPVSSAPASLPAPSSTWR